MIARQDAVDASQQVHNGQGQSFGGNECTLHCDHFNMGLYPPTPKLFAMTVHAFSALLVGPIWLFMALVSHGCGLTHGVVQGLLRQHKKTAERKSSTVRHALSSALTSALFSAMTQQCPISKWLSCCMRGLNAQLPTSVLGTHATRQAIVHPCSAMTQTPCLVFTPALPTPAGSSGGRKEKKTPSPPLQPGTEKLYTYIYINTHTHTHTHVYVYIYTHKYTPVLHFQL
jgi:hypothetical protein